MTTVAELVDSYFDAWNAHDTGRVASHFTPDGVRHWQVVNNPLIGGPARFEGTDEIEHGVKVFMDAVPDLRVEPGVRAETADGAIFEWRVIGTHTGAWGGWTGQGEAVDLPGVSIVRIADGKFAEERMYFDPDMMARNWRPPA
jgi:ketosteroid isomerase-like protein